MIRCSNFFIERYREAYDAEIDHFVDCVEKGVKPLAGFADGREALRLADAALESLRTGRVVRLDRTSELGWRPPETGNERPARGDEDAIDR